MGPLAMTFSEKFCAQNRISPDKFCETVLWLSLPPSAKAVRWVLLLIPDYFAPDRELINSVGRLKHMEGFDAEVMDFMYDPNNRGFLRRGLNLRVSSRRLHSLVRATFRHEVPATSIGKPRAADDHETVR
jgi:hypothetical protein